MTRQWRKPGKGQASRQVGGKSIHGIQYITVINDSLLPQHMGKTIAGDVTATVLKFIYYAGKGCHYGVVVRVLD